jgi:hypothetical protein
MSDMLCPISYFFGWEVEKLERMDMLIWIWICPGIRDQEQEQEQARQSVHLDL